MNAGPLALLDALQDRPVVSGKLVINKCVKLPHQLSIHHKLILNDKEFARAINLLFINNISCFQGINIGVLRAPYDKGKT